MRLSLRPHAGMRAHARACVCLGVRDKPKACYPAPHPRKVVGKIAQDRMPPRMRENFPDQGFGEVLH